MTKPPKGYPSTPSQIATAERRGWYEKYDLLSGKRTWTPPEKFGTGDVERIDLAQARRERRRIGAD